MSNKGAITRFLISALAVAMFFSYTSFKGLSEFNANMPTMSSYTSSSKDEQITENNTENTVQSTEEMSDSDTSSVGQDTAVTVSATGTVVGKVIERFISPYTANTSYDNVYLKNNTDLDIDLKEFVNGKLNYSIEKNGQPQVLIIHTHATESYLLHTQDYYTDNDKSRTTDNNYNMVALGKIIADNLNNAGITTLHDTTLHDYPSYNSSYSRAADTICNYTEKYSSIKVVIDLHRDAIAANDTDKVKVTTEINGKKAAQIMLVMGSQSGNVTNFPNWRENLKLAAKLQQTLESTYPTLARSIHFTSKNYNESLTNGSMLIEIGTDGNTFDEAKYSAELLSQALIKLFEKI